MYCSKLIMDIDIMCNKYRWQRRICTQIVSWIHWIGIHSETFWRPKSSAFPDIPSLIPKQKPFGMLLCPFYGS